MFDYFIVKSLLIVIERVYRYHPVSVVVSIPDFEAGDLGFDASRLTYPAVRVNRPTSVQIVEIKHRN